MLKDGALALLFPALAFAKEASISHPGADSVKGGVEARADDYAFAPSETAG